jgi:hypothetical protein
MRSKDACTTMEWQKNEIKYLLEKQGTLKIKHLGHETLSILKIANLDKHLNII